VTAHNEVLIRGTPAKPICSSRWAPWPPKRHLERLQLRRLARRRDRRLQRLAHRATARKSLTWTTIWRYCTASPAPCPAPQHWRRPARPGRAPPPVIHTKDEAAEMTEALTVSETNWPRQPLRQLINDQVTGRWNLVGDENLQERCCPQPVAVLAVLGRPVGVDAPEHAGGLTDLDEVAVRVT
jgi:hypothetical protein